MEQESIISVAYLSEHLYVVCVCVHVLVNKHLVQSKKKRKMKRFWDVFFSLEIRIQYTYNSVKCI